jgi:hypothetical protein
VWHRGGRTYLREELIEAVGKSGESAFEFCADLFRISRDTMVKNVEEELKYERPSAEVPEDSSLAWMKTLKMLIWDGEHGEADDFQPFLSDEDARDWQRQSKVPGFQEMISLIETGGDRVLEVRNQDDELVYNGRRHFDRERKWLLAL